MTGLLKTLVSAQHKTLLKSWQKADKPFHEIHSFPNILDKVKLNPITTIIGSPGSGKTTTAHHFALRLQTDNEFEIIPVDEISEIKQYGHPNCKQLFILDDVFGVFGVQYEKLTNLEGYKDTIFNVLGELSKILFTCRKAVYNEASHLKSFVLEKEFILDLEDDNNRLNINDREQILNNHCKQNDISLRPEELRNFSSTVGSIMYPLLCKLFCSELKYQALGKEFFENPYICIHKEMDYLKGHKRIQYASLVICMFCQNEITESMMIKKDSRFEKIKDKVLENCRVSGRNSEIKDALDNMINTFTIRTNKGYSLIHDAVYGVLASHYGNKHQEDMLEYMSSSFIANKFIIKDISDDIGDLHIKIHEKHYQAFAERIVRDLKNSQLHDVFMNKALKIQCICNALIDELKELPYNEIKKLFFQNMKVSWNIFEIGNIEWNRLYLLHGSIWVDSIRAISWVISYGHKQLLLFLFDQVAEHQESIRRVMELEIRRENGDRFVSNLQEQCRLLSLSCYSDDVEVVQLLLKQCDVECFEGSFISIYTPPLVAACRVGNMPVVQELIRHGASIGAQGYTTQSDIYGRTPIQEASKAGHVDVVDFLIKCGADCNQSDNDGRTPIEEASEAGHVDVVDLLIKCGADCNHSNEDGRTPIHEASKCGHVNVVDLLIKCGADCNQSDEHGRTPIHDALEAECVDVVDLLIKSGTDCNQSDKYGRTPIHEASGGGIVDVVDFLIKHGADCNQSDNNGRTPIHEASMGGNVEVVDYLIKCGVDCNQSDNNGRTPIHQACLSGNVEVVDRSTPIHEASEGGHVGVVDLLIKCGADCNQRDKDGRTPIHEASEGGRVGVVDFLIKCGADCNQSDKDGRTPIHEASERGRVGVVDLLIKCGADCNQSDKDGRTPLHVALEAQLKNEESFLFFDTPKPDYESIVRALIGSGADINQNDIKGESREVQTTGYS